VPLTCDWADIVDEDDNNSRQIFVSGLKDNVDEFKVRESFSTYGNVPFYFIFNKGLNLRFILVKLNTLIY
jgi:hypothetical protein